ncbi:monovalent cation/H+ antiporter complex subunit F [Microvirga arabica]|uniref:Monovalent cation/H+ antiporter complex subunit F n=1 Tax=Microvirga arabica TaxID=1128671 RepID=A0ABV6Y721_9HYPH
MYDAFTFAAVFLLITVAAALVRCWKGPGRVDRIMAAQLVGTGVIGTAIALGTARRDPAMLDAALTGTLLAAVLVCAFVRGNPSAGARPERSDPARGTEEPS